MKKREDVLEFLVKKIEEMKKEHVADLMRANRVEELKAIAEAIDLSEMDEYIGREDLELRLAEIPADSLLETVFVLINSEIDDCEIWEDWEELQSALKDSGKALECQIANLMGGWNLGFLTVEELLTGDVSDEEPEE